MLVFLWKWFLEDKTEILVLTKMSSWFLCHAQTSGDLYAQYNAFVNFQFFFYFVKLGYSIYMLVAHYKFWATFIL